MNCVYASEQKLKTKQNNKTNVRTCVHACKCVLAQIKESQTNICFDFLQHFTQINTIVIVAVCYRRRSSSSRRRNENKINWNEIEFICFVIITCTPRSKFGKKQTDRYTHVSIDEQLEWKELPERERNNGEFSTVQCTNHWWYTHRVHNLRFVPFVNEIIITKSRISEHGKSANTEEKTANLINTHENGEHNYKIYVYVYLEYFTANPKWIMIIWIWDVNDHHCRRRDVLRCCDAMAGCRHPSKWTSEWVSVRASKWANAQQQMILFIPIWFGLVWFRIETRAPVCVCVCLYWKKFVFEAYRCAQHNVGVCQLLLLLKRVYQASNVCTFISTIAREREREWKKNNKASTIACVQEHFSVQSVFGTGFMHM